jgi:hypothetical protein
MSAITATTIGVIGAAAGTAAGAIGGAALQGRATGRAARIQANSATEAARISGLTADKQLALQREEAARLAYATEAAQKGNYGQWLAGMRNDRGENIAGMRNSYNQFGDNAFNSRASEISQGLTGVNMANTDAYNSRSSDLSAGHNAYAMYADRERRLGALGETLGLGPREITPYENPAALREGQYFRPDPLQRTALELPPELEIPDYIPGNRENT